MSLQPFAPAGAVTAASLAGQTIPGALTLTGNLTAQGVGTTGAITASAGPLSGTALFASNGPVDAQAAGQGLRVAEGANAKQGTAVLVAGAVTVADTAVTANSRIFLTSQVDGGAPGFVRVSARVNGTSFTITSSSGTDTSTVAYEIFEPG